VEAKGELYRSDAKAEGDLIVLGGWELGPHADTCQARWYSIRLSRKEVPWAYTRGDPFRAIASLELLGTLLCLLVFGTEASSLATGSISLTASGDNQSNGFSLDKLSSTKYPLYLVLMELAEQLRARRLLLQVAWRPRDENEEADALTNEVFAAFSPEKRVHVEWASLPFVVLGQLTDLAEDHFKNMSAAKKDRGDRENPGIKAKRIKLREAQPW
jgi:hypothetical protein